MTASTFKKLVLDIMRDKIKVVSSKESALNALAREYERGAMQPGEAADRLKKIFDRDFDVKRRDYEEIVKKLSRY